MGALLPKSRENLSISFKDEELNVLYDNQNINGASDRMNVFKNLFGDQFQEINLGKFDAGNKIRIKQNVNFLVVRYFDIDRSLETNQTQALNLITTFFNKIKLAYNALKQQGFTDAIVASDHGFLLNPFPEDAGKINERPLGDWKILHDRAAIGSEKKVIITKFLVLRKLE